MTGIFSVNKLEQVSEFSVEIYNDNLLPISAVSNILDDYNLIRITASTLIATEDYEMKTTLKDEVFQIFEKIRTTYKNPKIFMFTSIEEVKFKKVFSSFNTIEKKYTEIIELEEQFMTSDASEIFYNDALTLEKDSKKLLNEILSNKIKKSEEIYTNAVNAKDSALNIIYLIIIISVILAFVTSFFITRTILKSINKIVNYVEQVSLGNFKLDMIKSEDEIGKISDALFIIIETLDNFNSEYKNLIEAVKNENYSKRCELGKFKGSYKEMLAISNDLMTTLQEKIY